LLNLFKQIAAIIFLPSYLCLQIEGTKAKIIVTAVYVGLLITFGSVIPVCIAKLSDKKFLELLNNACEKMHIGKESQQVINAFSDYPAILGGQEAATSLVLVALCSAIYNILTTLLLNKVLPKSSTDAEKNKEILATPFLYSSNKQIALDIESPDSSLFRTPEKLKSPSYGYLEAPNSTSGENANSSICGCLPHFLFNKQRVGSDASPSSSRRVSQIEDSETFQECERDKLII
jgi:hypothetical protein